MYSYRPAHMDEQKQDDQLEHTYSSYVRIRDVALTTCQRRWTIGRSGKRGSGISVMAARHDDDGDDEIYSKSFVFDRNVWKEKKKTLTKQHKQLIYEHIVLFTNPSARAGYDTRSIFKRSLTGLNSEFSFS